MGKFDFVKPSPVGSPSTSCGVATLPRPSTSTHAPMSSNSFCGVSSTFTRPQQPKKPTRLDLSGVNSHNSNGVASKVQRTSTLPHRSSISNSNPQPHSMSSFMSTNAAATSDSADTNPLRILRDKNFPIVRPRMKFAFDSGDVGVGESTGGGCQLPSPCESPSYILHTFTADRTQGVGGNGNGTSTSTAYSFSDHDVQAAAAASAGGEADNHNPVPLPPRDRNKVMQTNVKRHVRKYPLIIPVAGLQRNLSKVTAPSPNDEHGPDFPPAGESAASASGIDTASAEHLTATDQQQQTPTMHLMHNNNHINHHQQQQQHQQKHQQQQHHQPHHQHSNGYLNNDSAQRTYENLDTLRHMQQQQYQHHHQQQQPPQHQQQQLVDCTDSASLHFESILEDGCHQADAMASPEVNKDFRFDIQKDHQLYRQKAAEAEANGTGDVSDEVRNLDIEAKKLEFAQRYPKFGIAPPNELASHTLFNKVKELADVVSYSSSPSSSSPSAQQEPAQSSDQVDSTASAMTTTTTTTVPINAQTEIPVAAVCVDAHVVVNDECDVDDEGAAGGTLQSTNSVSCEDLLEFSDQKPKGRERGVESDEVRIMTKVLGPMATPAQFIEALDFIDWNVHRAIKLIMLRKTLQERSLTLEQCVQALQSNEWDMQQTTLQLKTTDL